MACIAPSAIRKSPSALSLMTRIFWASADMDVPPLNGRSALGRRHDHDDRVAFGTGVTFDLAERQQLFLDAFDQHPAQLLVFGFAAAELQKEADLVAFLEKLLGGTQLDLDVVLLDAGAELQ